MLYPSLGYQAECSPSRGPQPGREDEIHVSLMGVSKASMGALKAGEFILLNRQYSSRGQDDSKKRPGEVSGRVTCAHPNIYADTLCSGLRAQHTVCVTLSSLPIAPGGRCYSSTPFTQ